MSGRPLDGVTVIDLTIALAGPYATLLLAGLGATVIKVEGPGGDRSRANPPYVGRDGLVPRRRHPDDVSVSFLERSRGKQSVTLNLKHPRGREVFADLARTAHVVVENFSPGTADRLGVGFAAVHEVNPRAVYCSITGFGSGGEPGSGKAMDAIIQALSGAMLTSGEPDDPPVRVGIPLADLSAPLFAVIGILAALRQAEATGQGQHVDVSMLGSLTALVAAEQSHLAEALGRPTRTGRFLPRLAPFGVFAAADGWVAIAAPEDAFARGVLDAIERADLLTDDRFGTRDDRVQNAIELHQLIEEWTARHSTVEAVARLHANGVPSAPVRSPAEALRDPGLLARGDLAELRHPRYGGADGVTGGGLPIHLSHVDTGFSQRVPELGEDNDSVYRGLLGYDDRLLTELRRQGVV